MNEIALIIAGHERDLGGFQVRRFLPHASQSMVGPFIFFDHMGPAIFDINQGIDVRPHPHIGLATVTYLFEGKIQHRDSLGYHQLIEPGAINWMTAGYGVVHSERTPYEFRQTRGRLNGIQCWIALPEKFEDIKPSFTHHSANTLPEFMINDVTCKLLLGKAFGHKSPVNTYSNLFYLFIRIPKGKQLHFPLHEREGAVYIVEGKACINEKIIQNHIMVINKQCQHFNIDALEDTQIMLLGGTPLGERHIYWNFVSSSKEKIEKAKQAWMQGPGDSDSQFPKIPHDDTEFIPLPKETTPKGTVM